LNLADLFDTAEAETGLEKVMVVAYWLQVNQGQEDWDSLAVNNMRFGAEEERNVQNFACLND
jgi:hypothetical protein